MTAAIRHYDTEKEKPEISIKRNDGAVELSLSNKAHLLASYDLAEWFIIPETDSKVTISKNSDQIFYQAASEFGRIPSGIVLRTKIESDISGRAIVQFNVDTRPSSTTIPANYPLFIGESITGNPSPLMRHSPKTDWLPARSRSSLHITR